MRILFSLLYVVSLMLRSPALGAAADEGTPRLTLRQAIDWALTRNPSVLVSQERVHEARGTAAAARAPLLPNVSLTASQANETTNLASLGIAPGVLPIRSSVIGPYYSLDSRLRLSQSILNDNAVLLARSGKAGVMLSRFREALTREQTATAVETAYVNLLRAERAVRDAEANVDLSRSLHQLATDQEKAGIATGLDVTRAAANLALDRYHLVSAQQTADQTRIQFQRLVVLPYEGTVELADALTVAEEPELDLSTLITGARDVRPEARVAREQLVIARLDLRAAESEQHPTLGVTADVGIAGTTPTSNTALVNTVTLQLTVPLYNGGLVRAHVATAGSRLRQQELQLEDVYAQIEQDVRQALVSLHSARTQVDSAAQQVALAEREQGMARDRFAAGLGDNIEVVTAQTRLADARDQHTAALTAYQIARINLAASVGRAVEFNLGGTK